MIKLDKHSNLDYSVVNISFVLIRKLLIRGSIKYDELLSITIDELGERAETNYPYAINFLYMLDKIKYDNELDTFTLNETS